MKEFENMKNGIGCEVDEDEKCNVFPWDFYRSMEVYLHRRGQFKVVRRVIEMLFE